MSPLHRFGMFVRELLSHVPMEAVRALFLAALIALLIWVLTLPRSQTTPPKPAFGLSDNLKLWAALALILQILIYALL